MEKQLVSLGHGIAVTNVFENRSRFALSPDGGICLNLPISGNRADYLVLSGPRCGHLIGFMQMGSRKAAEVLPIDADDFHFNVSSSPRDILLNDAKPGSLAFNQDGAFVVMLHDGKAGNIGMLDLKKFECEPVYDRRAWIFDRWHLVGTKDGELVFRVEIDVSA